MCRLYSSNSEKFIAKHLKIDVVCLARVEAAHANLNHDLILCRFNFYVQRQMAT